MLKLVTAIKNNSSMLSVQNIHDHVTKHAKNARVALASFTLREMSSLLHILVTLQESRVDRERGFSPLIATEFKLRNMLQADRLHGSIRNKQHTS
jgi:glycerol-3-phosphate dehydrogenase